MDKINLYHHFAKYFKEQAIEPYLNVLYNEWKVVIFAFP